ncbi:MAG TPA: AAA family ATPase [Ottowia sp.]|nr:AAA family ATPase [Ottowia sp.]
MNPLLLKPEADTRSQVVLLGQVSRELSALPWRGRSERVWPQIAAALDALRAENDVVVIEGAGSPAEINLMASDVVNLRVAHHADARCLLVADIDRGGAFAHLYGTWALLPEADRARIRGFVLNKFRGDASLLAPAPEQLRQLTGVPTLAVVPMRFGHGLPEEDGVFDEGASPSPAGGGPGWGPSAPAAPAIGPSPQPSPQRGEGAGTRIATVAHARLSHGAFDEGFPPSPAGGGLGWGPSAPAAPAAGPSPQPSPQRGEGAGTRIAIVAYPRISNLDEFQPLKNLPGVRLCWARNPAALAGADWIILPGSKATAADLAWLRAQGLDAAIARHAARGGAVLGICGGLQMLGEALIDLHGVEPVVAAPSRQSGMGALALGATATNGPGLGLLPLVTSFEPQKTVRRTHARFADVAGPWSPLSGVAVQGYEIHSGQTAQHPAMAAKGDVAREVIPGLAWQSPAGNVLGCYLHGLFEDAAVLHALFGAQAPTLDAVFDGLAAELERAFAPGALQALIAR